MSKNSLELNEEKIVKEIVVLEKEQEINGKVP